ncbi:LPXTG cell wall anchor domain-containing protein [Actinoplanes sp. KI2]|uniref:LPXTG cell wall anchor domain-containing protein n=1 Tax=Actinoplanes sp. KI2 TaxID=2983315 RepID=UPI0021D5828D|nr:LPXTG cell wall anchor domain-containing protein [Actinoplanes sp. KI2]MCU7725863.1 LPXTG cell wall anchor domain-containing protein [Actinoplanes sp. KI2]
MSANRRILVAGLSAAAALFFAASPALAAAHPAATAPPCAEGRRDGCVYVDQDGVPAGDTRGTGGYGVLPTTPSTTYPTSPVPSTTAPTAHVDTVPPTTTPVTSSPSPSGVKGAMVPPKNGVSAGHALPVTGAPMGTIVAVGALMVAAGGTAVWYTRRRREA